MSSDIIKRPVKTLRVTTQKQDCNKCLAVIWTKNFAFVITNLLDTPCSKPPQCLKFYFTVLPTAAKCQRYFIKFCPYCGTVFI